MEKTILYYKFTPIADPQMAMYWQRALCEKLSLTGRIIISPHGINGTLGGSVVSLKAYVKEMNTHPSFKKTQYKWSSGGAKSYPRLSVKVKDEIVAFDAVDEIEVTESGIKGGGKHLKPAALHKLMEEKGDEVIFYDGRNAYEAKIGRFKDTIIPDVQNTRDFKKDIESGEISKYKDKPIVTYCTGGVRCEILSVLMKNRGFEEVYQMDGGIVKYGERYKNNGYWEGNLYVFDGRVVTKFDENAEDIGDCIHCNNKTSHFMNCMYKPCNKLVLVCDACIEQIACSEECTKNAARSGEKNPISV